MALTLEQFTNWIDALRGGRYQQGMCKLREDKDNGTTFCCLGVLADVIDPHAWDGRGNWGGDHDNWKSRAPLSPAVMPQYVQSRFIVQNDSDGKSFDEIADFAETNRTLLLGEKTEYAQMELAE